MLCVQFAAPPEIPDLSKRGRDVADAGGPKRNWQANSHTRPLNPMISHGIQDSRKAAVFGQRAQDPDENLGRFHTGTAVLPKTRPDGTA